MIRHNYIKEDIIPMAGWHQPFADCKAGDLEFTVTIAGGCQSIMVRLKGKRTHLEISINELLTDNFELIEKLKDMR